MIIFIRRGFTIIEIMIVLAIIAITLSIVIPNFLHMSSVSRRTVCINNQEKITAAIDRWALASGIPAGTALTAEQEDDIYNNYLRGKPVCPSGGQYTIDPLGSNPQIRCSDEKDGHKL
ncbi:MAG: prepilin-type N-terminal cleavage/methylation domain-containing protein [Candidatus Omnitrophota bacterium]|nr:prepilin-type N-terminal cleavage/methylation domain-containing protein [Candidatus Omnitrophota bacterium]